jgi:2-hydroxy-3-oxopropionate reductase
MNDTIEISRAGEKVLPIAQEHVNALSVPLPGTALLTSRYVDAWAHGEGGNGNQPLFRVYDRITSQRG